MLPFAAVELLGAIAAFSTLLGIALAILSHIQTRRSAADEASRRCHEELLATQRESERLSKQLHELRLKYGEDDGDEQPRDVDPARR